MTDITELALRLKLEAHRAVSNFNPQMNIKTRDLKELVEALEKAQTKAIEQGRTACELFDEVTTLRQRIAELESRTVKLPNSNDERFWGYGSEFEVKLYDSCVFYALTAAGIKWEAE
ncbi:RelE family toxin-antitoxin system [Klebsiella pneumoniae]|uniref:hypothetical protein n=1 Tax=Klebsiella pneumoniae TaxID=573 RepID=UPI0010915A04|nr:hypothetical protein [Klebsiella pneumoniae]MBD7560008.1 hypothetical protein [Klebsiella pneumoniae]MDM7389364.1 hypothetical protein [Klebsiella pneumoniae]VGA61797.1 RelE family toxin-antitoxin system [Klebsiella pneumoniae]HDY7350153.1 hypothetical protein [Klebsiella pneumoniae]